MKQNTWAYRVSGDTFTFQFALTDRNIQARFGRKNPETEIFMFCVITFEPITI